MSGAAGSFHEECANLAGYQKCVERIQAEWVNFRSKRDERLVQERRYGEAREPVAEGILEDLFTSVLDWPLGNFNRQVQRADIVLTDLGIKKLIVEAKHPGALHWNRMAVDRALDQAERYAHEQKVQVIAVSDGHMLYAANLVDGGRRDRIYVALDAVEPPVELWWLSVDGIWREAPYSGQSLLPVEPKMQTPASSGDGLLFGTDHLLHPKYHLPAYCFAYVGDPSKPSSWKMPYLLEDGSVDSKRLSPAIRCIVSNYRGAKVRDVPEESVPAVLNKLGEAARRVGRLPARSSDPSDTYRLLEDALDQLEAEK